MRLICILVFFRDVLINWLNVVIEHKHTHTQFPFDVELLIELETLQSDQLHCQDFKWSSAETIFHLHEKTLISNHKHTHTHKQ